MIPCYNSSYFESGFKCVVLSSGMVWCNNYRVIPPLNFVGEFFTALLLFQVISPSTVSVSFEASSTRTQRRDWEVRGQQKSSNILGFRYAHVGLDTASYIGQQLPSCRQTGRHTIRFIMMKGTEEGSNTVLYMYIK